MRNFKLQMSTSETWGIREMNTHFHGQQEDEIFISQKSKAVTGTLVHDPELQTPHWEQLPVLSAHLARQAERVSHRPLVKK